MAAIKVVLLVNTKKNRIGDIIEVGALDLQRNPQYYKPVSEVEAEQVRAAAVVRESPAEIHRKLKAELAAEFEQSQRALAEARAKALESDAKLAKEAAEAATLHQQLGEKTRREQELEAENARLRQAMEERRAADAKIVELRPAMAQAEKAAEQASPASDKPVAPHLRKREG